VIGFVDTLVEVNETDGQATLNVSITSPLPVPGFRGFEIMFSLSVASMEGSAGMDEQTKPHLPEFFAISVLFYEKLAPSSLSPFT